jgi:hypothetical protein
MAQTKSVDVSWVYIVSTWSVDTNFSVALARCKKPTVCRGDGQIEESIPRSLDGIISVLGNALI